MNTNDETRQLLEEAKMSMADGNLVLAFAKATQAISRNEKDGEALRIRGLVQYQMGRKTEAMDDFRRAVELEPALMEAINGLFTANGMEMPKMLSWKNHYSKR